MVRPHWRGSFHWTSAQTWWPSVREALQQLRNAFVPASFEPAESHASFTMAMADATAALLIPAMIEIVQKEAPGVSLRVLPLPADIAAWSPASRKGFLETDTLPWAIEAQLGWLRANGYHTILPRDLAAIELGPSGGVSFSKLLSKYDSLSLNFDMHWDLSGAHGGMTLNPSVTYFTPLSKGTPTTASP